MSDKHSQWSDSGPIKIAILPIVSFAKGFPRILGSCLRCWDEVDATRILIILFIRGLLLTIPLVQTFSEDCLQEKKCICSKCKCCLICSSEFSNHSVILWPGICCQASLWSTSKIYSCLKHFLSKYCKCFHFLGWWRHYCKLDCFGGGGGRRRRGSRGGWGEHRHWVGGDVFELF